tara:strand:- start:4 stop:1008 length:1005 start_codon:yes stop_codon:yes gene_type:complete
LKNKILLLGLLSIVTLFIFLNFRVYKSYVQQQTMLGDINNNTQDFLEFADDIEVDFPNTSVTSMHLKSVKARYLITSKRYDEALDLLNTIEYDPLKMSMSQKAEIYFFKNDLGNMYGNAKKSWESLPLNQAHLIWYLKALSIFNKKQEIINIYKEYKEKSDTLKWIYFYFTAAFNIMDDFNSEIIKEQAKGALYSYGSKNLAELNTILFYIIYGENQFKESLEFSKNGQELFSKNNFLDAAESYQNAIERFPINPDHYYNKMAALFQLNKHSKILETYETLPDSINPKNGQFEFLVGRSFLNAKDTIKACEFLNISKNYNYEPSLSYLKNLCLN